MKKKNNSITIVAVLLFIIGILLGTFGAYLYFDNSNKNKESNNGIKQNSTNKENTKEEEVTVPTDMSKVNQKLDEYLANYIKYRVYGTEQKNVDIIANSKNRLEIINAIYMATNTGTFFLDGQAKYVNISDYQAKYKELYGSLDSFDNDTKNATSDIYALANKYDSSLSNDLVSFNALWGPMGYAASFQADNIKYDKTNKLFTITGVVVYSATDASIVPNNYTRKFTLKYANNGVSNYITSLVIN